MDTGSQFELPPERVEALKQRHQKEQEEAKGEGVTPISEVQDIAEKGLAEEKKPLNPSLESLQFIEEEGRMFSDKQIEIAKISAFFFEKCAEAANLVLRGQKEKSFSEEDAKELNTLLSGLDKKYEDILQKPKEYESALEVISELRKNIPGFIEKNSSAISALFDIAKRIDIFHHSLLGKEGKSEYNIQAIHNFLGKIFGLIITRIPNEALKEKSIFNMLGKGETEEKVGRYLNLALSLPPPKVLEFEAKIKKAISQKKSLKEKERSLTSNLSFFGGSIEVGFLPTNLITISLAGEEIDINVYLNNGSASVWCGIKEMKNKNQIKKEIENVPKNNWLSLIDDIVEEI